MKKAVFFILLASIVIVMCADSSKYDKYGGNKELKTQNKGWFEVGKIGGRWYFITPEGNGFFSLGATHAVECMWLDELNLFETRYQGSEKKLSETFLAYFNKWGYNSSGYGALPFMETKIPYIAEVWTYGPRSFSAGDKSEYYDIFDPDIKNKIRKTIQNKVQNHKSNPFCLGYVSIDLPIWSVLPRKTKSYVDYFRYQGNEHLGKNTYLLFLKDKYESNWDVFSQNYGLSVSSYEQLKKSCLSNVSPKENSLVASDDLEFLQIIAKEYYEFVSRVFKESDPNHLYLGDRFMAIPEDNRPFLKTPDEILTVAAEYVDVISFQPMGTQNLIGDYLDHVANITGKPILLADVNCFHSRLKKGQVDTRDYETKTGKYTVKYYLNAIENNNLIGIHRCTVRDYRPWDTKYHRRGLLKSNDKPYPILEEYTIQASTKVMERVYSLSE